MGVRGRKPKPTETKRVTGNPGHRPLPENEPKFELGQLARPKWFTAFEREEWNRIVPDLQRSGVAVGVHQGSLEGICVLYGAWRKAHKDRNATEARLQYQEYRKALNEFGLTPASQGRVGTVNRSPNATDHSEARTEEKYFGPRIA